MIVARACSGVATTDAARPSLTCRIVSCLNSSVSRALVGFSFISMLLSRRSPGHELQISGQAHSTLTAIMAA
jgi:hypothetical protein